MDFREFLQEKKLLESDDLPQSVLPVDDINTTWHQVFPKSIISISKGALSGGLFGRGLLAGNKTEVANNILDNDILSYSFNIYGDVYKDDGASLRQNPPPDSFLAFGSVKMRSKTIKGIDTKKLKKRFQEIHDFIENNKENIPNKTKPLYDINDKL